MPFLFVLGICILSAMVRFCVQNPAHNVAGTKYFYTSHGWTLVAAVLEGATKRKFPDLICDLFRDLGLDNTYLDQNQPLIYNRARYVGME